MSSRISPAVSDAFRKHLLGICDTAAFDDDERPYRIEEWQRHLELYWHTASNTYDSDRAQALAIATLGDPLTAGKRLREPWWYRLLFHHRLRAMRLLILVMVGLHISFLQTTAGMQIRIGAEGPVLSVFFYSANSFLGGLCAILAWWTRNADVRRYPLGRAAVSIVALVVQIYISFRFAEASTFILSHGWRAELWIMLPLVLIGAFGILLAVLSLSAELIDLPSHKQEVEVKSEFKFPLKLKLHAANVFLRLMRRLRTFTN